MWFILLIRQNFCLLREKKMRFNGNSNRRSNLRGSVIHSLAKSAVLMALLSAGLLTATSAMAQTFDYSDFGYAGAEAGDWGGKNGAIIGPADNTCANMGAVGKVNLASDFGFAIPGDATITGIIARVKAGENSQQTVSLELATNATVDPPTGLSATQDLTVPGTGGDCGSTAVEFVGGDLAFWGGVAPSLTPADVNDPTFGLVFTKIQASSIKVDSMCLEIAYTRETGPGVENICFQEPPPETNTITVVKEVVGAAPDSDWEFTGTSGIGAFTLPAAGGAMSFTGLSDFDYTIGETVKPGYTASVQCFIEDVLVAGGVDAVIVDLDGGETALCIFTNTLPTGTFTVGKDFSDDNAAVVDMTLTCTSGTVTVNPLGASEGSPALFEVTGFLPNATCTATEAATPGYDQDISACQLVGQLTADGGFCLMVNTLQPVVPATEAVFRVTKDFTDNNPAGVMVYISCDTGLPLTADFEIFDKPGSKVDFVVTNFVPGTMACEIWEAPIPGGYEDSYVAGVVSGAAGSVTGGTAICQFTQVEEGIFTCEITNTPKLATVNISKDWVTTDAAGNEVNYIAIVKVVSTTDIVGGVPCVGQIGSKCKNLTFTGENPPMQPVYVKATYPSSLVYLSEEVYDDSVEKSNNCNGSVSVAPGGSGSCKFTNTVYFEGIPTLNQYGLAILALLMLGIGFVGIRRFV
jgi:hypothetical protein